jgi:hypothetical protein
MNNPSKAKSRKAKVLNVAWMTLCTSAFILLTGTYVYALSSFMWGVGA